MPCCNFIFLLVCFFWPSMLSSFRFLPRHVLKTSKYPSWSLNRVFSQRFSLSTEVDKKDLFEMELPTNENCPDLVRVRHTSAHIMACAVQKVFPDAKVTIGPWIENGFYYDFDIPGKSLSDGDFKKIKNEMDKIIKAKLPIWKEDIPKEEARQRILSSNEPYKLEILDSIPSDSVSIYHMGDKSWDLCAGPHVNSTGDVDPKAIALTAVSSAYWRGDETKASLQRIYGTAWLNPKQLAVHLARIEEAKKRDHRVLGKQMDLFSIQDDAGGGLVFWHPKGAVIRRIIEDFWKDIHTKCGYQVVYTPHMADLNLWKTSGHHDFYRQDMFSPMDVEGASYQIRPMNCPFHCLIYSHRLRSYRDLPIKLAEFGTVYRYERSGTLHGLFRVRGFTQDDGHVFCLPSQLPEEILKVLDLIEWILTRLGFNKFQVSLSTRPKESVGSDEIWEQATQALKGALEHKKWEYSIEEGGGAFYGPKIDVKIQDALGRKWQCSTVQCDFNLPQRFNLTYQPSVSGSVQPETESSKILPRPIMIHRAILGSLERFIAVLVESTGGHFPLWLAPVQLRLIPVGGIVNNNDNSDSDSNHTNNTVESPQEFARRVLASAVDRQIRVSLADGELRLAKEIRNAESEKIPLMAVVGPQEVANGSLSLRGHGGRDLGQGKIEDILEFLEQINRNYGGMDVEDFASWMAKRSSS